MRASLPGLALLLSTMPAFATSITAPIELDHIAPVHHSYATHKNCCPSRSQALTQRWHRDHRKRCGFAPGREEVRGGAAGGAGGGNAIGGVSVAGGSAIATGGFAIASAGGLSSGEGLASPPTTTPCCWIQTTNIPAATPGPVVGTGWPALLIGVLALWLQRRKMRMKCRTSPRTTTSSYRRLT